MALFAIGVITGTILSFEMGLLWPNFTATFGSVFGLGFAIEGFSFFMEAIFIGIYAYGWDRLSPRVHFLSGLPIVITGFTGSLTVISVNAWMNHPGGFRLVGGKVVDVNPWGALFGNSLLWSELIHMYIAGYMVTGFVMAGAYAFSRLRGRWTRYERVAMTIPLTIACLAAPVQVLVGDWIARVIAVEQPIKLAAIEGLYRTTRGASEHILGWYTDGQIKYGIGIPHLLSLLAFHSWNARVTGLDAVAASQRPPINVTRLSFQTMVGIGTLLALLGLFYLFVRIRRRRLPLSKWFYWAVVVSGPAATVALIAGWVTTEVGRQPWVVYHVMTTAQSVTGASGIPVGYTALVITYIAVAGAMVWILRRLARSPLRPPRRRRASRLDPAARLMLDALPLVFVLIGLVLYTVLAGADFGAGMWQLMSGGGERGERIRDHCHHSMGPVWEANHVWLIFVLTVTWTAYPVFFGSVASTLALALFIAALGIILRGASYALRSGAAGTRELRDDRWDVRGRVAGDAVRARRGRGRHRGRTRPGRQRGGESHHQLAEPDLDPDRPVGGGLLRLPGRRLPRRRRREARGARPGGRVPGAGTGRRRRRRRHWPSPGSSSSTPTTTRCTPVSSTAPRLRSSSSRSWWERRRWGSMRRAGSSWPATRPRSPWRSSSPTGRSRDGRRCCPA